MNEKYNTPTNLAALQALHKVADSHNIDVLGASLRWLAYHSPLSAGDGIILGASKVEQIEDSSAAIAKGPLPEDVVAEFDRLWQTVKANTNTAKGS
jgi:aflatoxin B1 aldehyde reductase